MFLESARNCLCVLFYLHNVTYIRVKHDISCNVECDYTLGIDYMMKSGLEMRGICKKKKKEKKVVAKLEQLIILK